MIKVSVVVPAYNVEKYIRKCLTSLVGQTLEEIEILVVNDGSTDGTQGIIDEFADRYPDRVLSLKKENGGVSDARNYGMSCCKGEYIGFVDPDDYVESDMYEVLYREAKEKDADLAICDYVKEYADGSRIVKASSSSVPKEMFLGGLAVPWNKIYKKTLLDRSEIRFPKGYIYEDTEFFCLLIPYVKRCAYVDRVFVHYLQRKGSIANTQGRKIAMIFDIFDHVLAFYEEKQFMEEYRDELTYFIARVLLGSSMERICRCDDRQTRKELLSQTVCYLDTKLVGWRHNRYLAGWRDKRNLYMRSVYSWNIGLIAVLLRLHFSKENGNLL